MLSGCSPSPPLQTGECGRLLEAKENAAALTVCTEMYEKTQDTEVAIAAAKAAYRLGDDGRLAQWARELVGSGGEVEVLPLVAYRAYLQNRIADARRAYQRERDLWRVEGDLSRAAAASHQLYRLHWESSDYGEAHSALLDTLRFAEQADDRGRLRSALESQFAFRFEIGDLDGAEAALAELEDSWREGRLELDDSRQGWLLVSRALVQEHRQRPRLAVALLNRALEKIDPEADRSLRRSALLNLTDNALVLGDLESARAAVTRAAELADTERFPFAVLFFQGRVASASGSFEEAAEYFRRASALQPPPDWRWEIDYELGRALQGMGRFAEAHEALVSSAETLERMRREVSGSEDAVGRRAVSADLKAFLLDKRRRPLEALFEVAARRGDVDEALRRFEQIKGRWFVDAMSLATERTDAVKRASVLSNLGLGAVDTDSRPRRQGWTPEEIRNALQGVRAIGFLSTEERLWRVSVESRDAVHAAISIEEVKIEGLPALLQRISADAGDAEAAEALHRLLPAAAWSESAQPLHVILDGPLARVPMAALTREGRFLVQATGLAYVPSFSVLAQALRSAPHRSSGRSVIVLADSKGDLPAARREARNLLQALDAEVHIGDEANQRVFRQALEADWLHLALHTGQAAGGPWIDLHDQRLEAADMQFASTPRGVFLATCSSAVGRSEAVWGSVAASFLSSGARAVVASTRPLSDRLSERLVRYFYEAKPLERPVTSLAAAQRRMVEDGFSPADWSSLVVLGTEASDSANEEPERRTGDGQF